MKKWIYTRPISDEMILLLQAAVFGVAMFGSYMAGITHNNLWLGTLALLALFFF